MNAMHVLRTTLISGDALLGVALQDPDKKPAAPAPAAPAAPVMKLGPEALEKLAWIVGTWSKQDGGRTTEEHWRPLQGSSLLGTSHLFDAKRTMFFEFLRITAMNGTIAYVAQPGGKPPTVFLITKLEEGVVEFENGKHDHPQRIRYEKTAAGVTATISQLDGSRAESFVFTKK